MRAKYRTLFGVVVSLAIGIAIGFSLRNDQLSEVTTTANAEVLNISTTVAPVAAGTEALLSNAPKQDVSNQEQTGASPLKALPSRDIYYPGSEDLAPDEIRIVCCGSGMSNARPKQAAACWLVELGNGDKFLFDIGSGSAERISAMKIPYVYLDIVFIGHRLRADTPVPARRAPYRTRRAAKSPLSTHVLCSRSAWCRSFNRLACDLRRTERGLVAPLFVEEVRWQESQNLLIRYCRVPCRLIAGRETPNSMAGHWSCRPGRTKLEGHWRQFGDLGRYVPN